MLGRTGAVLPFALSAEALLVAQPNIAPMFTDVTSSAGLVHARNISGDPNSKQLLLEEMGCGAAFFDYDNDGWLDIAAPSRKAAKPGFDDSRDRKSVV